MLLALETQWSQGVVAGHPKIVSFGFLAKEVVFLLLLSSIRVVIRTDRRNYYLFGNAAAAATAQGAWVPYVKVKE